MYKIEKKKNSFIAFLSAYYIKLEKKNIYIYIFNLMYIYIYIKLQVN
jgi:hypothetical protein